MNMRKLTDAEKAELQKKIETQRQDQTARFRDNVEVDAEIEAELPSQDPVSSGVKVLWIVVGTVLYGVLGTICVLPFVVSSYLPNDITSIIIGGIFSAIIGALIGNQAPRSNIAKVAIFIPPVLAVLWIWWFFASLLAGGWPSN